MNLHLDMKYAAPQLLVPDITRALGQAITMTPLAAIAMVGISSAEAGSASGLFNMLRNLGGAIGTSALETFFTKREQYPFVHHQRRRLGAAARNSAAAGRDAAVFHGAWHA